MRPMRLAVRRMRQAISPTLAINSFWKRRASDTSTPDNAEAGRLWRRRVEPGGERQSEHGTGISGVDDPIIPQPRRGVIGMALPLVLLAQRSLESLLIGRAPAAAPGLDR